MIAAKSRVDTWLGRFTMYRLILWVLGVLVAYSMLLNILGWLTFGLPEMLVHLVLCLDGDVRVQPAPGTDLPRQATYGVIPDYGIAALLPVLACLRSH